jgi:hypothetical protein
MVPNTVKMHNYVKDLLSGNPELGGILGPSMEGWSNLYSQYFLGTLETVGRPVNRSHFVHSWQGLEPRWSQSPQKLYGSSYGAIMYPVQDSSTPPPLQSIEL